MCGINMKVYCKYVHNVNVSVSVSVSIRTRGLQNGGENALCDGLSGVNCCKKRERRESSVLLVVMWK